MPMAFPVMTESVGFASLPTELLVKIILHLDWRTVLRLQLVNSELNEIVKTHTAVQYHVELGIAGMTNGPPAPHSLFNTDERLTRLRLYQSRWKHFNFTRVQTVRKVSGGSIWELASGVLAQGISTAVSAGEHFVRNEQRKLLFTKLPSSARVDSKTREWTHDDYEFAIRDFTIDPTQDLLVLLRDSSGDDKNMAEVHIRSLRSNAKHPAAKLGVLNHALHGGTRATTHSIQVCQDRFAVLHKARAGQWPEKLVVYDWRKGKLLFEISFCGIMSFAFLSPRHLLFAVQPFNVMPACHGDHQARLVICDVDCTAALSPAGRPMSYAAISEFQLPELRQYADIVDILIRADPAPNPFADDSSCDAVSGVLPGPAPAFVTAPNNRLFVITLQVETVLDDTGDHRASESLTLGLFVPLSTFLPFMRTSAEDNGKEPEIIPANSDDEALYFGDFQARPPRRIAVGWHDWMRDGARALLMPGVEGVWVCNVFGSRCVYALEPRDVVAPLAPRHLAILDFNADALRCDRASRARNESDGEGERERREEGEEEEERALVEAYTESSTLEAGCCGIFEEDVVTTLPYRRTVLREKLRFHAAMLTEDNIILVNQRAPRGYEVLTF